MDIYQRHVFPKLLDIVLSKPDISALRKKLLQNVDGNGDTLELGFGTGLNLPHYPPSVHRLTVLDPNPGMNQISLRQISKSPIEVISNELSAETLPFSNESFDTVVSTWTLCSIPNFRCALKEVARVLRPGGRFLFLEHGLSRDIKIQKWQHRLSPLNEILTCGCHINRNIADAVAEVLHLECCDEFYFKGYPRTHGYFYLGSARKLIH